jgi:YesN/AraC family two-component response regulator
MKLLIVDDEIYAIQGMIDSVDWNQFEEKIDILTANSYSQAVNLFMQERIDLLICDIEMPYGNGLDLVEWVKQHNPDTECIFLTCHEEFDFARQAVSLRCMDYLLKPAMPDKITEVIRRAQKIIQGKRQSQQYEQYGKRYVEKIAGSGEGEESASHEDAVVTVEKYIQDNISDPLTVEELAKIVYLSPDHLTRLFKKKHGVTVIDYLTEQRMRLAAELLKQKRLSITMISAKTGYNNYSYFTKIFKKYYGVTPREYQGRD